MNDSETTVYGLIFIWLLFLETVLSIPGIVLGVIEPEKRKKIQLLVTASINALPGTVFLIILAYATSR